MGLEQFPVHPGLGVKPLGKAFGDHAGQIAVPLFRFAEQHQMAVAAVQLVYLILPGAGSHIDLAADDGLDSLRLARLVEVHHAVHDAVVGDGHGALAQLLHPLDQQGNAAGPVQQGIFGMDMQVDKGH